MTLVLRSLLFNAAFYLSTLVQMIVLTPVYFLLPRKKAWFVPKNWARSNLWLMKVLAGTDHVVEGLENLPEGSYILAPKHQSAWDTFAFLPWWPDPIYILKRELMWIPLFGWYVAKMRMIPIDRGNRTQAVEKVNAGARQAVADGRQIVIYPEGTRRAPGAEPAYKLGIAHLYAELDVPVVPIAHNAGLYWPRRKFLRYPGTIRVQILKPIPPGLSKKELHRRLVEETEAAVDADLLRIASEPGHPPLPESARRRLAELGAPVAKG